MILLVIGLFHSRKPGNLTGGAGEMAQQLQALFLQRLWVQFPTHRAHSCSSPQLRADLFWLWRAPGVDRCTDIHAGQILMHINTAEPKITQRIPGRERKLKWKAPSSVVWTVLCRLWSLCKEARVLPLVCIFQMLVELSCFGKWPLFNFSFNFCDFQQHLGR